MGEQYQASRGSVREALRLLEVQGLVHLKPGPGGGPVVGTVDPANLARMVALYFHLNASTYGELLESQALLEAQCAQRAATNPDRREVLRPFLQPETPDSEVGYRLATAKPLVVLAPGGDLPFDLKNHRTIILPAVPSSMGDGEAEQKVTELVALTTKRSKA